MLERDSRRWIILKRWGEWELQASPSGENLIIEGPQGYWLGDDRWGEPDWISHMRTKSWVHMGDFTDALTFARSLKSTDRKALLRTSKLLADEWEEGSE